VAHSSLNLYLKSQFLVEFHLLQAGFWYFSVITVAETGTKIPLVTDEIQPEIAILDTPQ
jgi:hypothetical protein